MRQFSKWLIFVAQCAVLGLALAFVVVWIRPDLLNNASGVASAPDSYASAVSRSMPAVVNIRTAKRVALRQQQSNTERPQWPPNPADRLAPREAIETSLGSGVIVSDDGYVLTNNHVIDGADAIQVQLADGRITEATIVGTDQETDLAVLKISLDKLPVISMGTSNALHVGDVVLAIGSPFGLGQTVTQGIISATGRSDLGITTFENFIQTDAAISKGNSGGALVDTNGRLVGINTALLSSNGASNGIGFAIPVNLARGVMRQLIEHGRVIRGWLGVVPQPLTPELAEGLGLKHADGVLVRGVYPGSPAAQAGLQPGDVIRQINGEAVHDMRDALNRVAAMQPGTQVTLSGMRRSEPFSITATVVERTRDRKETAAEHSGE